MIRKFIVGGSMIWLDGVLWVLHDQLTLETKQSQLAPGAALVGGGLAILLG